MTIFAVFAFRIKYGYSTNRLAIIKAHQNFSSYFFLFTSSDTGLSVLYIALCSRGSIATLASLCRRGDD